MRRGKLTPKLSSNVKINGWVKVYETTLSSPATSVTISGLAGDTDKEYMLECRIVNGYNGAVAYGLRPNNDSGTNYGFQYLLGDNTTASAARNTNNNMIIGEGTVLDDLSFNDLIFQAKSGYLRTAIDKQMRSISGTTVARIMMFGHSWNNTVDEITSLVVLANQVGGIGVGSNIVLWKKVTR